MAPLQLNYDSFKLEKVIKIFNKNYLCFIVKVGSTVCFWHDWVFDLWVEILIFLSVS